MPGHSGGSSSRGRFPLRAARYGGHAAPGTLPLPLGEGWGEGGFGVDFPLASELKFGTTLDIVDLTRDCYPVTLASTLDSSTS